MAGYDFDTPIERRGTASIKWSGGDEERMQLSQARDGRLPHQAEILPMWLADMDFAAAPPIRAALEERVRHGVFGYTHYGDGFFEAIAQWAVRRHGWGPRHEWIVPNSGVMPAINLLIQTLTAPGDGVIVQPPVFRPIPDAVEFNARRVVANPLLLEEGGYVMDLDRLSAVAALPGTRLMILCSPHNPVGRVWTSRELATAAEICAANDVILISDEIHGDLTYPWAEFVSAGSLADHLDRIIVCTGPSKAFNLPGLRLSVTIIPDPQLRATFLNTLQKQNELWGANLFGAAALEAAYREGEPWLEELLAYLAGNLEYVANYLAEQLPELSLIRPEALYLPWIDCRRLGTSGEALDDRLQSAGLWVENGATYGREGEGFLRMTIATPRIVVEEAMARLERALRHPVA